VRDAVVVLKTPTVSGEQVTFDVQVLEGELAGADGAAVVFIDIIGMPWTPLSYQTPPRHPCHQWELKLTGSSRGKSPLGSARFSL
jgi:hypothetical protein